MKVGDLVTMSSYGKNLVYIEGVLTRRRRLGLGDQLIGMVVQIKEPAFVPQYKIKWMGKGPHPKGRAHYLSDTFDRKDLKVYKKA